MIEELLHPIQLDDFVALKRNEIYEEKSRETVLLSRFKYLALWPD